MKDEKRSAYSFILHPSAFILQIKTPPVIKHNSGVAHRDSARKSRRTLRCAARHIHRENETWVREHIELH
ncbi:MAG: hypothetical protein FJ009_22115 [Chloroflexi bacterium]|nr:hypothetical protein [Chloroflexota bacterium]